MKRSDWRSMPYTKDQILAELTYDQLIEVEKIMRKYPKEVQPNELMIILKTILLESEVKAIEKKLKSKRKRV
ncbi:hypothetical protein [Fictibacillus terranigra]|uniref:Uncharacterized protein n=1 Tax=Fictibacillus terranigra TaxID=3058424 RepID=A0ABT8EBH1_9BACL|nr:hypothetical protein [Fictibacillus sp. CENA-BCM004]MDN4075271.1 hypothetical protein [Fictibacillus sp. CENA-BCM004]